MTARPQDVALLPKHEATLRQYVSHLRSKSPTQSSRPRWSDIAQSIEATLAALASAQAREEELRAEVERLAALHVGYAAQAFTLTNRAERLEEALRYALNQNEHDMVLTGDEIRSARAALSTNAATQTVEMT